MEITGLLVKKVNERQGVSKNNGQPWKTGEYLVEMPGQYPKHINFNVRDGQVGRIAKFDSLIGKMVTVSFDIDAREYEGRWYNDLNAWGVLEYIDQTTRQANIAAAQGTQQPAGEYAGTDANQEGEQKDDLPF